MRRAAILACLIAAAGAALAGAPDRSLRPVARPADATAAPGVTDGDSTADQHPSMQTPGIHTPPRDGLRMSLRPHLRPKGVGRKAAARKALLARGAVCGDAAIQGIEVGRIPAKLPGCGVENAVKVRSINGITLSQRAIMDCRTARTLKAWMAGGMARAVGGYGGGVKQLTVAAHYACRTRNNRKGAKISEHGKGHAIDIAGFTLSDGTTLSVLKDWGGGRKGRILRQMHRSACGPFGTVLGPGSDGYHRNHIHLDTVRYRAGSYCR